jgi:hypothetical protein
VGDNALILRQLGDHRPPKNPRLLRFYSQVRRFADQLNVRHWTHQVRAYNRMADNYAHAALATGVRECVDRYPHQRIRLHVIGECRLVLQQVIGVAQTKQRTLRRASDIAAQALSLFQHLALSQTLRAGNTMTDNLANCAMNDQYSSTSSTAWTTVDAHLVTRLQSDTSHALTPITRRPASDILSELASTIARQRLKPPD